MTTPPSPTRSPMAGGFLIGIGMLTGTIIGAASGQTTLGFLIGAGIGIVLAVGIWLKDRSRG